MTGMEIHVTERATYKRCRRQWDYSSPNRQNLERKLPPTALELGTLLHRAIDDWWQSPTSDLDLLFRLRGTEALKEIRGRYREDVGAGISPIELVPLEEALELGVAMCRNYQAYFKTPWPPGWTPLALEQTVLVPIPGTPHFLSGKLDKIAMDEHGVLWPWDHKSFDKHPSEQDIHVNDQFLAYLTMAHLLFPDHRIGGLVYDGLWKRPAPTKGRTFDDLFMRRKIYRNTHAMNEFLDNLIVEVGEMSSNPAIYPARDWTCSMCSFRELCIAQTNGEDVAYLRSHVYRERPQEQIEVE